MRVFKKYKLLFALLPMIGFTVFLSIIGPDAIIQTIWIENSYIFMFIVAFIWGISLFAWVPYPLILITLALWWSNLVYLSLTTTIWVMLWDSTSYYVWGKAKKVFQWKTKKIFKKILSIYDLNVYYISGFLFLYWIFSPFPNDMITLSSWMRKYNFRKTMIPLTLGNFIFCLIIAHFAEYFIQYF